MLGIIKILHNIIDLNAITLIKLIEINSYYRHIKKDLVLIPSY